MKVPLQSVLDKYMATVCNQLRATLWEAQSQSMAEAQRQKQYYDQKIGTMDLKPGNLVLVKADAFQGKRKIKDRWEDGPHEVVCQIVADVPLYKVMDQCDSHVSYTPTVFSSSYQTLAFLLYMGICQAWDRLPAPPQISLLPREVTARLHHE